MEEARASGVAKFEVRGKGLPEDFAFWVEFEPLQSVVQPYVQSIMTLDTQKLSTLRYSTFLHLARPEAGLSG